MAAIESVEQATQLAIEFVRKYYYFVTPISTRRELSRWIVDMDVSYFKPSYAHVRIVAETGAVEDFKVTLGQLL
jgi:hypothetical protein